MINTKCSECMFGNIVNNNNPSTGCSKQIIDKITHLKKIVQEDGYNKIEEYACRYGFSKKIYEEHKDKFINGVLEDMIKNNSHVRYYLLLDFYEHTNFDEVLVKLSNLTHKPSAISFMFRSLSFRPFLPNKHTEVCDSLFPNIKWKAHNFLEHMELNDAINNILATNAQTNYTSHFLVYNAKDIDLLDTDINTINNDIILYQKPMIAMLQNNDHLYKFCMSFQNYNVAKSISLSLLESVKNETNLLYY